MSPNENGAQIQRIQASGTGGKFNIFQCSIVVWIGAKAEIQISHSSIEIRSLLGATVL